MAARHQGGAVRAVWLAHGWVMRRVAEMPWYKEQARKKKQAAAKAKLATVVPERKDKSDYLQGTNFASFEKKQGKAKSGKKGK